MNVSDIPERCGRCGYDTSLYVVVPIGPRHNRISCQVCGLVLATQRRPERPRIDADVPDAPIPHAAPAGDLRARLQELRDEVGESWRGSLAATGPRRPMSDLIAELSARLELPSSLGVVARRNHSGHWT